MARWHLPSDRLDDGMDLRLWNFLGAQWQSQVANRELLYLASKDADNLVHGVLTTKDRGDGAFRQVGSETCGFPEQSQDLFDCPCLMGCWPDEEDDVVRVQAALKLDSLLLRRLQHPIPTGLYKHSV